MVLQERNSERMIIPAIAAQMNPNGRIALRIAVPIAVGKLGFHKLLLVTMCTVSYTAHYSMTISKKEDTLFVAISDSASGKGNEIDFI
mmetsp:Transcript_24896/g.58421  ORF Transcript_24896/g.58421 Transcript_24896/m.58421 type:complete len:88 (+) Transcript_24896:1766-2029(+)